MAFRKMIDMARSAEDMKQDMAIPSAVMERAQGPSYPYGLSISLDDEALKKLGIDGDMPDLGDMIHLMAMAKVTSASMSATSGPDGTSKQCCRVELQITHLGLEDENREDRGKRWYSSAEQESDEAA